MQANPNTAITRPVIPPPPLRNEASRPGFGVSTTPKCRVGKLDLRETLPDAVYHAPGETLEVPIQEVPTNSRIDALGITFLADQFVDLEATVDDGKTIDGVSHTKIFNKGNGADVRTDVRRKTYQEGDVIFGYRLKELLDKGGMGRVFLAEDIHDQNKVVVIKVAHEGLEDSAGIMAQAKMLDGLGWNPYIVKLLYYGSDRGREYSIMEKIKGITLYEHLENVGKLSPEKAIRLALDLCFALGSAHAKGIPWRDVKPLNIMIIETDGERDRAVLLDPLPEKDNKGAKISGKGTPKWMAPEQFKGIEDTRSDLYSLGLVFYNALTGKYPFGEDISLEKILSGKFYRELPQSEDVPSTFWPILHKLTALEPGDRYQDLASLASDLIDLEFSLTA